MILSVAGTHHHRPRAGYCRPWGERRLDEPTASEIRQLADKVKTGVVQRRNARGGRGAVENVIGEIRCLCRRGEDDKLITQEDNPARAVAKPRRPESTRRAIRNDQLAEINHVAATIGNDQHRLLRGAQPGQRGHDKGFHAGSEGGFDVWGEFG